MDRGFSLIEVLIASTVLMAATLGLAQLSIVSAQMNGNARLTTVESALATQKAAQLEALAWTYDADGAPVSDTATDTTVMPERATGGTGLTPSPTDALVRSVSGYVDYIDVRGRVLGGGDVPPAGAVFVRRWSIVPALGTDALVIQVSVTRVGSPPVDGGGPRRVDEARILTVRARKDG